MLPTTPKPRLIRRHLALLAALLGLALPLPGSAHAAGPDPYHCAPPPAAQDGGRLAVRLSWDSSPMAPGGTRTLGVLVRNHGNSPTTEPTQVVVHNFVPTDIHPTGPGKDTLTHFTGGVSWTVPAGLGPGSFVRTQLRLKLAATVTPNSVEHCDVTAYSGDDQATARYDVVTGDPEVSLRLTPYGQLEARPGQVLDFGLLVHNSGPSNEYTGPVRVTAVAPALTSWAQPLPYGCALTGAAQSTLSCGYQGAPVVWRDEFESAHLAVSPAARPGMSLTGGLLTIEDPYQKVRPSVTDFRVNVVG